MDNKKLFGQFYTINYRYILSNLEIPLHTTTICDPFVGQGDLLGFIDASKLIPSLNVRLYYIDPKPHKYNYPAILLQDTLITPTRLFRMFYTYKSPHI
jgi:hypothetical protein